MTLNVAVIGCGSWGENHARVYTELPLTKLEIVVDLDKHRARLIGEKYRADWSTDIDTALDEKVVEAVSVCTPTVTHADIALRAIEAGKHVLVEKPMTNTIKEAKNLIGAAEKRGVKLSVGFVERFNPAVTKTLELIEKGSIGDVILAHTKRVSRRPLRVGDIGVIKDLAIHDIDIVNQIFRIEPETVFCTAGSIAHQFEDYANINLRYPGNRNAFIETNWLTPRTVRDLTVTGSEGIITVHYRSQELTIENDERLIQPFIPYQEPLYLELENFASAIMEDSTPKVTGRDGLRALSISEAALLSTVREEAIHIGTH
jgi:UDP-N-acetylglucosamine 3-dehydrogenase